MPVACVMNVSFAAVVVIFINVVFGGGHADTIFRCKLATLLETVRLSVRPLARESKNGKKSI